MIINDFNDLKEGMIIKFIKEPYSCVYDKDMCRMMVLTLNYFKNGIFKVKILANKKEDNYKEIGSVVNINFYGAYNLSRYFESVEASDYDI